MLARRKRSGNIRRSVPREIARTRQRSRSPSSSAASGAMRIPPPYRLPFPAAANVIGPSVRAAVIANPRGERAEVDEPFERRHSCREGFPRETAYLALSGPPSRRIRCQRFQERRPTPESPEIDQPALSGGERGERLLLAPDSDLEGEIVAAAGGQDGERRTLLPGDPNEAVHDGMKRSIAARRRGGRRARRGGPSKPVRASRPPWAGESTSTRAPSAFNRDSMAAARFRREARARPRVREQKYSHRVGESNLLCSRAAA